MYRVLYRTRLFRLHAYPAMLYIGLLAGVMAGRVFAVRAGLDASRVTAATVVLVAAALVGSRLLFVAVNWAQYRGNPARIWRRSEGGAALYGGLLLALLVSVPLLRAMDLSFGAFWDVAAVTMLVGMMPTRAGCVLNGCCAGRPTTGWLALSLPNHQGVWRRRIPVQLMEAACAGVLLAAAMGLWASRPFEGAICLAALAGYGMVRFVLEPLREAPGMVGSCRIDRAISAALAGVSLTALMVLGCG